MRVKALLTVLILISLLFVTSHITSLDSKRISGAPPYGAPEEEAPDTLSPYEKYKDWERPDVPPKIGIQVGHWKNEELPDELERLKGSTGAEGGGKMEWEVNYAIAEEIKERLTPVGVEIDLIPATVPPEYWADVFISIHADGSLDSTKSGYKFAGPWRDFTNKSDSLVKILDDNYEKATGLTKDDNITRNMRGYYAFSWWRNEHAVHPMTVSVIAETGFLTNWSDQQMLIYSPEIPGEAISDALLEYLEEENLVDL